MPPPPRSLKCMVHASIRTVPVTLQTSVLTDPADGGTNSLFWKGIMINNQACICLSFVHDPLHESTFILKKIFQLMVEEMSQWVSLLTQATRSDLGSQVHM